MNEAGTRRRTRGSRGRAVLLGGLAAALIGTTSPAVGIPAPEPTVNVSVQTDRMVFLDQLYRASFVVDGACIPHGDDVVITSEVCGDPQVTDLAEGSLRKARFGFEALRTVEAVPADVPLTETAAAAAPEQLDVVRVALKETGDLTVRVIGSPEAGLDPRPVAGSASPGGEISDRSVTWRVVGAGIGAHEFSVRFRPGAPAGFAGSFVPEVAIEFRRNRSTALLENETGLIFGPLAARISTLTMRQRVSPASAPPAMSAGAFHSAKGSDELPVSWETTVAMDGRGHYEAAVSGAVSARTVGEFDVLAPGSLGVVDTAAMLTSYFDVRGEAKARPFMDFEFTPDGHPSAFVAEGQTTPDVNPFGLGAGSTIWDGDTMVFGVGAGFHTLDAKRTGPPANDAGTLRPDWGGGVLRNWSGTWANLAPGGEPNALNPQAYLRSVNDYGILHRLDATIPMVVTGGDLDSRAGGTLSGEPASVSLPAGQCPFSAVWISIFLPETNYGARLSSLAGCPGTVNLTPEVGGGGYWLESARDGYARDWSMVTFLSLTATEQDGASLESDAAPTQEALAVVPGGAAAEASAVDAVTGRVRRLELSPGVWRVVFSSESGLSAVPLAPSG